MLRLHRQEGEVPPEVPPLPQVTFRDIRKLVVDQETPTAGTRLPVGEVVGPAAIGAFQMDFSGQPVTPSPTWGCLR